jgi:uncharacterized RDD family membrane protein YckC
MLDTLREVQTPEGIDLHLPVAGLVPRALAWLIDALIRSGFYLVLALVLRVGGKTGVGLFLLLAFFIEWFYPVLFEVLRGGQTPGKRAYDMAVINDDGTPVRWSGSLIRNLLRFADFLPAFYGFGIISILLNRDFKRLGDLAAGTLVVYQETRLITHDLPKGEVVRPPFPLTLEEQQAIIAFAERSNSLTAERSEELARLSGPLVEGAAHPVARLYGMAKWLMGTRKAAA